jgi:hypothetical protein
MLLSDMEVLKGLINSTKNMPAKALWGSTVATVSIRFELLSETIVGYSFTAFPLSHRSASAIVPCPNLCCTYPTQKKPSLPLGF